MESGRRFGSGNRGVAASAVNIEAARCLDSRGFCRRVCLLLQLARLSPEIALNKAYTNIDLSVQAKNGFSIVENRLQNRAE